MSGWGVNMITLQYLPRVYFTSRAERVYFTGSECSDVRRMSVLVHCPESSPRLGLIRHRRWERYFVKTPTHAI